MATILIEVGKAQQAFNDWKAQFGPFGQAIDVLLLGPLRMLAGAIREVKALMADLPMGGFAPSAPSGGFGGGTGGGTFTGSTTLGPAPIASTRTPTIVAPLTALNKATAAQARRTGGKVVLLR